VTFHAHAGQDAAHGKAAVRQAFANLFAQFPDLAFAAVSQRTGHDFWVAEWRVSGTLAGTDSRFEVDLVDVVTVGDGLVKSKDSYIDAVSMQAQVGMAIAQ
jgi:ketosteroid isomerase-like protein